MYQISGKLLDASTGGPIPYATFYCPSCDFGGTVSNELGEYVLSAPTPVAEVRVDHIMYRTLEASVSEDRGNLRMQPEVHELPQVVVDGTEALQLVERAYARLQAQQDQSFRGEGFYRQTTRQDEGYTELLEYFVRTRYSNRGMGDWKVTTGRYAIDPAPRRIGFGNHSYWTRGWKVHHDVYDPDRFVTPVNPAAFPLYDFRIAGRIAKESGEVILVDALPTAEVNAGTVIAARLYIDKRTAEILQADYSLDQLELDQPERGAFSPARMTATIRFRSTEERVSLIQSMQTRTSFSYSDRGVEAHAVEVNSVYLNFPPRAVNGQADTDAQSDFDDLRAASAKKYRPKWWDRHPVIAATPVEREVIEAFNQAEYFGNYFEPGR